jgi:large subunit ribosomal protein L19e
MKLNQLKQLAARTLKVGKNRVKITDEERAAEAITREDVRDLIKEKVIVIQKKTGVSRGRARKLHEKKKRGQKKGIGKRRGTKKVRTKKKKEWMKKVRAQRKKLKQLSPKNYRSNYKKVKGGHFKTVKQLETQVKKEASE